MSQEFDQLEFRWTGEDHRGYSVIASSNSRDSKYWETVLQPLARPPKVQRSATVVYKIFGEEAAIIFRRIQGPPVARDALRAGQPILDAQRNTLVARALVGPADLLSPPIALACAALGFPSCLSPSPGEVREGETLPAVLLSDLEAEVKETIAELDGLAREDQALELLVAEVLTAPATPLTLQLPEDLIGSETATALLWGLWRTTHRFLAEVPDWSFSTGEAPAGNTDPGQLPHLVVQGLPRPGDQRPAAQRDEVIIQPRTVDAEVGSLERAPTARLLVAAYRGLPVDTFLRRLDDAAAAGGSLDGRLMAIREKLREFSVPEIEKQLPVAPPEPGEERPRDLPSVPFVPTVGQPEEAGHPHHAKPRSVLGPRRPKPFSHLFERLAADDDAALDELAGVGRDWERPDRGERAALRITAARRAWFVRQIRHRDPRHADYWLSLLLDLIVTPDLADPACRRELIGELARRVPDESTPASMILALESLIWNRGDYEFQQRLLPMLGLRWLNEHGRFGLLSAPMPITPASVRTDRAVSRWKLFKKDVVPARWANLLSYIVIVETLLLAVLLAVRL
jgi:hypothetical protein